MFLNFPALGKPTKGESRGGCQTKRIKESGASSEVWKIYFTKLKLETNGQFFLNVLFAPVCANKFKNFL